VGQLWKYLGLYGSVAASCAAAGLIFVVIAWAAERAPPRATSRPLLLIATLLGLLFVLLYPISRSGLIGGGSDRADALDVALRALLAGHQPYHQLTYRGNPVTPLPGALLLASPFYLLGSSALQNLFWAPVLVALAPSMVGSRRAGVGFLFLFIVFCPGSLQDFVTGGDYLVNVIYVAVSMHFVMLSIGDTRLGVRCLSYLLFAVSISSRAIYVVEVPILTALIAQRRGLWRAMEFVLVTGAAMLTINGPLFLSDPNSFPLLHAAGKLNRYPPGFRALLIMPAISLAIACSAFFWPMSPRRVFQISTLSLVPMFVPGLIYQLLTLGPRPSVLIEAGFSLPLTVFGGLWLFSVVAAWSRDATVNADGGKMNRGLTVSRDRWFDAI
jgi:hypothetical protein